MSLRPWKTSIALNSVTSWTINASGVDDRLTQPDFLRIDPAERDDGRAHALGAEARKGLRVLILKERRDREDGCRGDDALAPTSMNTNLEH